MRFQKVSIVNYLRITRLNVFCLSLTCLMVSLAPSVAAQSKNPAKKQSPIPSKQSAPNSRNATTSSINAAPSPIAKRTAPQNEPLPDIDLIQRCLQQLRGAPSWQAQIQLRRSPSATLPTLLDRGQLERLSTQATAIANGTVLVERPERIKIELAQPNGPTRYLGVGDGKEFWQLYFNPDGSPQRCTQSLSSETIFSNALAVLPDEASRILSGQDILNQWQKEHQVIAINNLGKTQVDGAICSVISVQIKDIGSDSLGEDPIAPNTPTHDTSRITFVISDKDLRLFQISIEKFLWGQKGEFSVVSMRQYQSNVRFSAREFVFSPPHNVQVTRLTTLPTNNIPHPNSMPQRLGTPLSNIGVSPRNPDRTPIPTNKPTQNINTVKTNLGEFTFPKHIPTNKNFGIISILDKRLIQDRLIVKNNCNFAIRLNPPQGSCFCITGKYLSDQAQPTLQPGEQVQVEVTLDLGVLKPGAVQKAVFVSATPAQTPVTAAKPIAQLTLSGAIKPLVTIEPEVLDIGQWRHDKGRPIGKPVVLTTTFDPRLINAFDLEKVNLSGPDGLKITPLKGEAGSLTKRYQIEIDNTFPIGPVLTTLRLTPPETSLRGNPSKQLAWNMTDVTVIGNVGGDVQAQPAFAHFGVIKRGSGPITRQVTLVGSSPETLDAAEIYSESNILSAKFQEQTAPSTATGLPTRSHVLVLELNAPISDSKESVTSRVTLASQDFRSQVIIRLKNGQRLAIPVSAVFQTDTVAPSSTTIRPSQIR